MFGTLENISYFIGMKETKYSGYFVDTEGNLFSNRRNGQLKKLNPPTDTHGYVKTVIINKKTGKRDKVSVHRLVAEAYLPNPMNKRTVNHKNGIKTDNRLENLEWMTQREQMLHAYATGLRGVNKRR